MAEKQETAFHVSTATILKIILILLAVWFVYLIRDVIALIFISFVLASAFIPWVDYLQKRKIPRVASVIAIYVVLFGIISIVIVLIIPALVTEIGQLASRLPQLYNSISGSLLSLKQSSGANTEFVSSLEKGLLSLSQSLLQLTTGIFGTLSTVFGGLASAVAALVIVFYMTVEQNGTKKFIQSTAPLKYQPYLVQLVNKIQTKMGSWIRGQLLLSLIIGLSVYIGLSIFHVKYALVLGLLAGIFEIIPFIGPIFSALVGSLFALADSPIKGLVVLIMYIVIQQLENNLIVPKVMQKVVGLNPLVVLIAALVGARVGGFLGVVLAVPVAAIVAIFFSDVFEERRSLENKLENGQASKRSPPT
ncbi:MAG: AI-2E family transporter [bacterium]